MPILSQTVTFVGKIHKDEDLSAIANFEIDGTSYLAVGSDESKNRVQLLKQTSAQVYEVDSDLEIELPSPKNPDVPCSKPKEIDIESLALDQKNNCLYVIGSHSYKRRTVKVEGKKALTVAENRVRLMDKNIEPESDRNRIFQVFLKSGSGKVKDIKQIENLKTILAKDDYLKRFIDIPSKENGIDIEGLAFRKGKLFLGFRGPILRGNYVPVLVVDCETLSADNEIKNYDIRFVQLNGSAIRDMTAVAGGFLIIAGPMGDAPGPYGIYFWDGTDMVYGTDCPIPVPPAVIHLEKIEPPIGHDGSSGKAEGITVLEETATGYRVLIIYDSVEKGYPQFWHIHKA